MPSQIAHDDAMTLSQYRQALEPPPDPGNDEEMEELSQHTAITWSQSQPRSPEVVVPLSSPRAPTEDVAPAPDVPDMAEGAQDAPTTEMNVDDNNSVDALLEDLDFDFDADMI